MNQTKYPNPDGDIIVNFRVTLPAIAVTTIADRVATAIASELKHALTKPIVEHAPELTPISIPQANRSLETSDRLAYSQKETAKLLGISYASVHRLIQRGLLKPSGALRVKMITKQEIQRFLNSTTV